jgi:two-component system sensor histidine kinase/response regulator
MSRDMKTEEFLSNLVNRTENITDLLNIFISHTKSKSGAMLVREGDTLKYTCICHIIDGKEQDNSVIEFKPSTHPLNIIISSGDTNVISTTYSVDNQMIIPIGSDIIGVICLMNSDEYTKESIKYLTPFIGIAQLVLGKYKISNDYRTLSDTKEVGQDLFLANMSHEIRTPLNGVIGYNQLLMQTDTSVTQREYLKSMNQCSIQLMKIINDVLDFSKLSSGKMGINDECVSIAEVLSIVHNTIKHRIKEKKQQISFKVDAKNIPDLIVIDKQKLIQILINLVSNAYKFSGVGGEIDVLISGNNSGILQISVKDNGIGISLADQQRLFNVFEQLSPSKDGGTGLGLVITKKLTSLLGGSIKVSSEEGKGTIFEIHVTYKLYEDLEKKVERAAKTLKGHTVLVVDDNIDNRIVLTEMLFDWGMKPIACASALEALTLVLGDRYRFSLGLIDICMPTTTGVELAHQIKKERPYFPLIALSSIDSYIMNTDFEQKLDKPLNKVQLFDSIQKVIKNTITPSGYIGSDDETPNSDSSSASENFNKGSRILIAEDIVYNRNMLVSMLETYGYSDISTAENGQVAQNMLQKAHDIGKPFDIILLDLLMPVMDGYDIINEIHKNNWSRPEIIVVTASILEKDRTRCKEQGVKYFIEKPIQLAQLKDVMLHASELS